MKSDISHFNIIEKLKSYVSIRKRKMPFYDGICNGASLILSTDVYEALDAYYKNPENQNIEILHKKIKEAVDNYFKRIETLVNQSNPTVEDDPVTQKKSQLLNTKAWYDSNHKLQDAINKSILNISEIDKSLPHYEALLRLAQDQKILTLEEANLLRDARIEDIAEYEDFLNEALLLQLSLLFLYDAPQTALPELFPLLHHHKSIPKPIMEDGVSFVLTPLELAECSSLIFPENRPILLYLPKHATFAVRVGNEYQFYDINNSERLPFTEASEVIVCLSSMHDITLQLNKCLKEDFSNNEIIIREITRLADQLERVTELQKQILEAKNRDERITLIKSNLAILSPYLGFSLSVYSHPSQPRLNPEWHQSMIQLQGTDYLRRDSSGETVFWKACAYGQIEFVKYLLEKGISPDTKNDEGVTAFYMACKNGHLEILELLKAYGIDVNTANNDGITGLYVAAITGNDRVVKWLLDNQANTNAANATGKTSLMNATYHTHIATMQALIDNGADINAVDNNGFTAFLIAANEGHIKAVRLLYENNAKIDIKMSAGNALHLACIFGHPVVVEYLLSKSLNPNEVDSRGFTPLMGAIYNNHTEVINILLNCPSIDINYALTDFKMTALHLAIQQNKIEVVIQLCNARANVNLQNVESQTPLDMAIKEGKAEIAFALLQYGAVCNLKPDIYKLPAQNNTQPNVTTSLSQEQELLNMYITCFPTLFTTGSSLAEKIGLLFKKFIPASNIRLFDKRMLSLNEVTHKILNSLLDLNNRNWSPAENIKLILYYTLYAASLFGNYVMATWLLGNNANTELSIASEVDSNVNTPLIAASAYGHPDIVQLLLNQGAEKEQDALFEAAFYGHSDVIKTLIKNGFDVNARDELCKTPLMRAAISGNIEAMQVLIENHADVNAVDNQGSTALIYTAIQGHIKAIEFLCANNATIDVKLEEDNVLHLVCQFGNPIVIEYLLNKGFNPNEVDHQGITPLMIVSYHGHTDAVNTLLDCVKTDINYALTDSKMTALHLAIQENKTEVVVQLCDAGANVGLQNVAGQTPLDMAVNEGYAEIAFLLIQHGAVCNIKPEIYKHSDQKNDAQEESNVKNTPLSQKQELLNIYIKYFPSLLTAGNTLAEKIGLIFKEIIPSSHMGLFDKKTLRIHQEAREISNLLLNSNNRNWDLPEIAKLIFRNTLKMQDKYFQLPNLLEYLLSTELFTAIIGPQKGDNLSRTRTKLRKKF